MKEKTRFNLCKRLTVIRRCHWSWSFPWHNEIYDWYEIRKFYLHLSFSNLVLLNLPFSKRLQRLSKKYDLTVSQLLLKWCLQNGYSCLMTSRRLHRIAENAYISSSVIQDEDIEVIFLFCSCSWNTTSKGSLPSQNQPLEAFCRNSVKGVPGNFAKFTVKHLC